MTEKNEKKVLPTDLRRNRKVNCILCRKVHLLSELKKISVQGVDVYICKTQEVALARSVEDGKILPIIGNSII